MIDHAMPFKDASYADQLIGIADSLSLAIRRALILKIELQEDFELSNRNELQVPLKQAEQIHQILNIAETMTLGAQFKLKGNAS